MRVTLEGEVERRRSTEAIRCRAETSDTLLLQCRDCFVDNRFPRVGAVSLKPLRTVPVRVLEVRFEDRIGVHDVWNDGLEAVGGESVREELYQRRLGFGLYDEHGLMLGTNAVVDQLNSKDIGEEKDDLILWVFTLWSGDIAADTTDSLIGTCDELR